LVYLIHFDHKLAHAQHYLGYASKSVEKRLKKHQDGTGARLMQVIGEQGIGWELAKVWPDGDRTFERRLKNRHGANKFCPICKQQH
jgi:predicted GIY-YIG superfamily endonuclease